MKSIISICTSYVIYNAQQQRKYIYICILEAGKPHPNILEAGQTSPQHIIYRGGVSLSLSINIYVLVKACEYPCRGPQGPGPQHKHEAPEVPNSLRPEGKLLYRYLCEKGPNLTSYGRSLKYTIHYIYRRCKILVIRP